MQSAQRHALAALAGSGAVCGGDGSFIQGYYLLQGEFFRAPHQGDAAALAACTADDARGDKRTHQLCQVGEWNLLTLGNAL